MIRLRIIDDFGCGATAGVSGVGGNRVGPECLFDKSSVFGGIDSIVSADGEKTGELGLVGVTIVSLVAGVSGNSGSEGIADSIGVVGSGSATEGVMGISSSMVDDIVSSSVEVFADSAAGSGGVLSEVAVGIASGSNAV